MKKWGYLVSAVFCLAAAGCVFAGNWNAGTYFMVLGVHWLLLAQHADRADK